MIHRILVGIGYIVVALFLVAMFPVALVKVLSDEMRYAARARRAERAKVRQ